MKKEILCRALWELDGIAGEVLKAYPDQRIFALQGEMGAGKTTFIQALCRQLGVHDFTGSPTFSLVNEYDCQGGEKVYHFDFYRIRRIEEVYDIGYEDYFYSGHYCFIEWPELITELLPEESVEIKIMVREPEGSRIFVF